MIRTRAALVATLVASLTAACGSARAASLGMSDTTFVATLSDLRRIESDSSLDVTMRDSTRRLILRRHKVTSTQLEQASRILAQTPARASDLWRQIESVPRATPPKPAAPHPDGLANEHPVQH